MNLHFIRNDLVHDKTGHIPIKVTFDRCSRNHYCRGKAMSLTYSEGVTVALDIQHVMLMRHIILFSVASPSLSKYLHIIHKGYDFQESLFKLKYLF